jgi:hypothetical protein
VTPLQKVAMGLVIVLVDAFFGGYDAVPDPVGWGMVIAGLLPLRPRLESGSGLVMLAGLCLLVSVVTYPPAVTDLLDESGGWALSLPQIAFSFLLSTDLARLVDRLSSRFLTLRWLFLALAAGPVLVFGGDVEALRSPIALLGVGANLYLVYLLFRASPRVSGRPPESKD